MTTGFAVSGYRAPRSTRTGISAAWLSLLGELTEEANGPGDQGLGCL